MNAPRCARCGDPFELRCPGDRHCAACLRELAAILAPKSVPKWLPTWRRAAIAKSLSGLPT